MVEQHQPQVQLFPSKGGFRLVWKADHAALNAGIRWQLDTRKCFLLSKERQRPPSPTEPHPP
jgi:hypothetical protein